MQSTMIIYGILAHNHTELLKRLIFKLKNDNCIIVIHLDKKMVYDSNIDTVRNIKGVFILPNRLDVIWAGYSFLEAMLEIIKYVQSNFSSYSHLIFLSGQCFPIQKNSIIIEKLNSCTGKSMVEYADLPYYGWGQYGGLERFERFHFTRSGIPFGSRLQYLSDFLYGLGFRRTFLSGLKPYGGSDWLMLCEEHSKFILNLIKSKPRILSYFKFCQLPSELFFQTLLLSNDFTANNVINDNLRYIDWKRPKGPYPAILGIDDFNDIITSGKFFARKFNLSHDEQIIYKLENYLGD